jgi:hypothetical protein
LLADNDLWKILKFLMSVNGVYDLILVLVEFLSLLVSRTSGRITQILVAHLGTTQNSGSVRSAVISTFLSPHVNERFIASYVLDRFQSSSEDLNNYIMVVVRRQIFWDSKARSLSWSIELCKTSTYLRAKAYMLFASKPESVQDLFFLATTVVEAITLEEQRRMEDHAMLHRPSSLLLRYIPFHGILDSSSSIIYPFLAFLGVAF